MQRENYSLSLQQQQVYDAICRGENVALFGDAGTGKSIIVKKFMRDCASFRNIVCLAPTGLAARNIDEAQTIHSFFGIEPGTVGVCPELNQYLKVTLPYVATIIIDEISMVRSDLFDIIEQMLSAVPLLGQRKHSAFGGRQLVVVGDFKQLPPVVSDAEIEEYLDYKYQGEYAFMSSAWQLAEFKNFYLSKSFRQNSHEYYRLLRSVRNNSDTFAVLGTLNSRVLNRELDIDHLVNPGTLALCSTRRLASETNKTLLANLPNPSVPYSAIISGCFPVNEYPAEKELLIKVGAKVMLIANKRGTGAWTASGFEYVNGEMGVVVSVNPHQISVQLVSGCIVNVTLNTWFSYQYILGKENGVLRIRAQKVGSFRQFPVAIAYASTIHKAQGQTLGSIYLKLGNGCFAPGQLYTALSRIRNLECLFLDNAIKPTDMLPDPVVDFFYNSIDYEFVD